MLTLRMLSLTLRMLSRTTAPMVPIETAIDVLTPSSDISSIHCHCSSYMRMSAMKKPIALLTGLLDGLERWVPDLRVARAPEASHWIVHEQPTLVTEEILRALVR